MNKKRTWQLVKLLLVVLLIVWGTFSLLLFGVSYYATSQILALSSDSQEASFQGPSSTANPQSSGVPGVPPASEPVCYTLDLLYSHFWLFH